MQPQLETAVDSIPSNRTFVQIDLVALSFMFEKAY